MKKLSILILIFMQYGAFSQISTGDLDPNPYAQLDIVDSKRGILIPRIALQSQTSSQPISSDANDLPISLLVFNTNGTAADLDIAYYYWLGLKWERLISLNDVTMLIDNATVKENVTSTDLTVTGGTGATFTAVDLAITDGAVTTPKLADNAITTDKIADKNVIVDKLANGMANQVLVTNAAGTAAIWDNSSMPKFFYMPSAILPIDTSDPSYNLGTGEFTMDLYSIYSSQFGLTNGATSKKNPSASTLPVLANTDLEYFITYYDSAVFQTISVSDLGVLKYKLFPVIAISDKTFMNIIFKVK